MTDPQQEFFTQLKLELERKGYDVYDGMLPAEGTPYPFIYFAECIQSDKVTKSAIMGRFTQTIKVWINSPRKRGTLSQILADIKYTCYKLEKSRNFSFDVINIRQNIFADNTTKTPLLQGVLDVEMRFS